MTQTRPVVTRATLDPPKREERILVADDNATTRYHVVRVLRHEGFEVVEADSGNAALAAAAGERPDLIILDVKMPDMLGFEVTQRVRADPAYGNVAIMHLSATYTDADAQAYGLGKGADAYLTHPVEPQVLTATVNALLRLQRSERRLADLLQREQLARVEAERALAAAEAAERQVQVSQRRLLRLSESGIIGLAYWTEQGTVITDANDAFLRMVSLERADLERGDITITAITHPQWEPTSRALVEEVRQVGVSAQHEMQFVRKDGSICDVLVAAAGLEPHNGLLLALDISLRKRAEHERRRLLEELEESLRARDEFLAMATHDLRSPLGALQLKLELISHLHQSLDASGDMDRQILSAQGQIDQIAKLLDNLLDTSRIRFGHLPIQLEPVNLGALVTETADRMAEQARVAGCDITREIQGDVVGMWDHLRLEQLITNLLANALKYGAGRPVGIRVSGTTDTARLDIQDNGPGISREDQARVFAAFERGPHKGEKGFGLGLWIVRRIVEAFNGKVWVESEPGRGATFSVELPRA